MTVGYVCERATGRNHARGHRPDDPVPVVVGEEFFPCEAGATTAGSDVTHEAPVSTLRDEYRASDFPFQKKQFSVSKKVKFRFDSVSLLATLNSMKSQYIERKCGPSKWHN